MATYPSPVIFVPGIMGSALRDEYPVSPETVWSPFKFVIKAYERITPHPDNLRYELREPSRVVKDQVFELFYQELIEELRHNLSPAADEPVPVFPFAYDWRQPLADTQEQLAEFVEEVIERTSLLGHYNGATPSYTPRSGKVSLVGHSMGGLIIAGFVQKHGLKRVDRIATIASPFRGSPEAVAKVAIGIGALGLSPGSSREREAARVTPALYHLLPSYANAVQAAPGLSADLYEASAWQPSIIETLSEFIRLHGLKKRDSEARGAKLLGEILAGAREHRVALEKLQLDDPKRWLCIVGVGSETRLGINVQRDAGGAPTFVVGKEIDDWQNQSPSVRTGDGTVPYEGAEPAFVPRHQLVCLTPGEFGFFEIGDKVLAAAGFHSALPNMNLAQRLVISHLSGRRQGEIKGRPAPGVSPQQWDPPIPNLAPA